MAKLKCKCGHIAWDTKNNLPFKAWFIRDLDIIVKDKTVEDICSFIEACEKGKKIEWLHKYFEGKADVEMRNDWIITEIQIRNERPVEGWIYQCEKCGRIRITKRCSKNYVSFVPAGTKWKDLLKGNG